jgi:hypothetical protein
MLRKECKQNKILKMIFMTPINNWDKTREVYQEDYRPFKTINSWIKDRIL